VGGGPRPDFGAVVLRHQVKQSDVVSPVWIFLMAFGAVFLTIPPLILDPRPGPPRTVFFIFIVLFAAAAVRMATSRWFSTPSLLLEKGIYLPLFRPRHYLAKRRRAFAFSEIRRIRLDDTAFRAGSHVFETSRGPVACPKAYFPAARALAEAVKGLAPAIEVVFEDRRGRRRKYAPVVARRRRDPKI
jgi:hypothetical protein